MGDKAKKSDNTYETPTAGEPHYYTEINDNAGYVEIMANNTSKRAENVANNGRRISCMKGKTFMIILTIFITTGVSVGLTIAVITFARVMPIDITSICTEKDCGPLECAVYESLNAVCLNSIDEMEAVGKSDTFRVSFGGTDCPAEWDTYASWCYKSFNTRKTWQQARDHCRSMGTELLSIHDSDEMNFLVAQYLQKPQKYWIGLNKLLDYRRFVWSDGSHFNYSNWDEGEPNNVNNIENCVHLRKTDKGVWNDAKCYVSAGYICKSKRAEECGFGQWEYFNGSCYFFRENTFKESLTLTWEDARRYCMEKGSDLTIMHSINEFFFILSIATRLYGDYDYRLWIGLNDFEKKGFFKWVDGSNTQSLGWPKYSPNRKHRCVAMSTLWGSLADANCNYTHGYICEKSVQ